MSESEAEDDPANEVTVNESKGAGEETKASKKSSVRLTELGPRLSVEVSFRHLTPLSSALLFLGRMFWCVSGATERMRRLVDADYHNHWYTMKIDIDVVLPQLAQECNEPSALYG